MMFLAANILFWSIFVNMQFATLDLEFKTGSISNTEILDAEIQNKTPWIYFFLPIHWLYIGQLLVIHWSTESVIG